MRLVSLKYYITLLLFCLSAFASAHKDISNYVDTRVGTAASITKTAGMFGKGTEEYAHTLPAVLEPFGMNFWTPQTRETEMKGVCPYIYSDILFQGIRCSHWIVGGCTQDFASFTILPTKFNPIVADSTNLSDFYSPLNHEAEIAKPYLYSLSLHEQGIRIDVTSTSRTGMLRFDYADSDSMFVIVRINNDYSDAEMILPSKNALYFEGHNPIHRIYQGWGERAGHEGHFYIEHNGRVEKSGRIDRHTIWVKFAPQDNPIIIKAANSFTSIVNARKNLVSELPGWNFDEACNKLKVIWNKKLSQIVIDGTDEQKTKFYGAMYRTSFLPHVISDVDGSYPKFSSGEIINDNTLTDFHLTLSQHNYYDDFSMWDTYRSLHPLLTIIEPQRDGEMIQSLVRKYEQGGWMPIFPCWNSYTAAMIGDHCTSVIADAYVKGIRNFNIFKAYEGLRKNAFEIPESYDEYKNGMGRRALDSYLQYGYIPLEDSVKEAFHQCEQTSRTLEYAYDDYALAQLAYAMINNPYLKDSEIDRSALLKDYEQLMKRSNNWKNVVNKNSGWAGGRHADGTFAQPKDTQYIKEPEKYPESKELLPTVFSTFITEGVPCHYSWYVPHDVPGLINAMGGKRKFELKLDGMFGDMFQPDAKGLKQLYWHGNEPCHQIAYLYNFVDKPEKAAKVVRNILATEYLDAPGGLSGNDDAGQMSAWYVFSSLGFYPVCPSVPEYYFGSPTFKRAELRLENGKIFTIQASDASEKNIYIKSVKLNGKPYNKKYITHGDIVKGGCLEFEMTDESKFVEN